VGVLGPIRVAVDGAERQITAGRQRAVLAFLASRAGRAVSADRLLDEIWGDDLPQTGAGAVAFQISKLRDLLEPDRVGEGQLIGTSAAGYTLQVEQSDVDVLRFEHLLTAARDVVAEHPGEAEGLLAEALALWRGPPFDDLSHERFVEIECRRLEQRLLLARRTLAEARIALGRFTDTLGDLEELVVQHPLEEALVELLMTALHRSGRTADALRAFGDLRLRLSAELGIEPSQRLKQRENELLIDGTESPLTMPRPQPIPLAPSSFLGRTEEIELVTQLLSSARLVTLCGFGGLGKTRLAQQVASTVATSYADGVWFVDLTTINDPSLLAETFLAAGGGGGGTRDPVEHLLAQLRDRSMLLVVDNCEHVIDAAARLVTKIVQSAPDVGVLATSRVSLGVAGEVVVPVGPLDETTTVELFVERSRPVRRGVAIDESSRADVERLCQRFDGIPLAVELAAARLTVMSLEQLVEHIDDRLGVLARGGRGVDEKQRSLAAVMEWSYGLLDERDQTLLRRMSLCTGGFTLEAAAAIGTPDDEVPVTDLLDRLTHLVETSLVVFDETGGAARFKMLEPVRGFAAARVDDVPGERSAASFAHASYFAGVAASIKAMVNTDEAGYIRLGDRERGNLHDAITWAYANGQPRLALEIVRNTWFWFKARRMHSAVLRYLRAGIELINDESPDVLEAAALALIADTGSDDETIAFRDRAAALIVRALDSVDDPTQRSNLLRGVASYAVVVDPRQADRDLSAASRMAGASVLSRFAALHNRVANSWVYGPFADTDEILSQIDALVADVPAYAPPAQGLLAVLQALAGCWEDVLLIADATADETDLFTLLEIGVARVEALTALGRYDEARTALRRIVADGGDDPDLLVVPFLEASLHLAQGEPAAAVNDLAERAAADRRDRRRVAWAARLTAFLGAAAQGLGQHETAAVLIGHSAGVEQRLDIRLRLFDHVIVDSAIAECRAVLGDDRFAELASQGAALDFRDLPQVATTSVR